MTTFKKLAVKIGKDLRKRGVPFGTAMRAGKLATAGGDDYLRFLLNKGCVTISTVYLDDDYLGHRRYVDVYTFNDGSTLDSAVYDV